MEAYTSQSPVVVTRVADEQARWPGYVAAAAATGVCCVSALPFTLHGVPLGSISIYSGEPLGTGWQDRLDESLLAAVAAAAVLADVGGMEDGLYVGGLEDEKVAVATGMLADQLHVSVDDALMRIRAFAFGNTQGLGEVAGAIMDGSLRLP